MFCPHLFFAGCSGSDASASSSVAIYKYPVADSTVFTSKLSVVLNGEVTEISGPWFQSTFAGFNDTDLTMLIVALEVTCTDGNGQKKSWSPTLDESFIGIAIAAPRSDLVWTPTQNGSTVSGAGAYIVYVGELPNSGSLRYRCQASFEGWFYGAEDDPDTPVDETTLPGENFKRIVKFNATYSN